jgi:quercetin dioxygenase-like cupin family protein
MYYDQPITNEVDIGAFASLASDQPHPGVTRRTMSSERATVTWYAFDPGAAFPAHRHPQEQITIVQSGSVEMTIGDDVHAVGAGGFTVVAPDVQHGVIAGAAGAEILAVIVPPRANPDAYTMADA